VEYVNWPARTRVKAGASATFINVGDIPHTVTATKTAEWDSGALAKGESKAVTLH
jgi:plastocyanin